MDIRDLSYLIHKSIYSNPIYPLIRYALEIVKGGVPPCKAICKDPLPNATEISGLELTEIIPIVSPKMRANAQEKYAERDYLYAGDKLVYKCKEENHGVYGGPDTETAVYGCTDKGIYDTPDPEDDENPRDWPKCAHQRNSNNNSLDTVIVREN